MAVIQVTDRALRDLERLADFLHRAAPATAVAQMQRLRAALALLADHPLLGHPAEQGRRELVVSRGQAGYVIKYVHVPAHDVVLVLAIRHQRELGIEP